MPSCRPLNRIRIRSAYHKVNRSVELEIQGNRAPMSNKLKYVTVHEFERVTALKSEPFEQARLFATLCRINTLYMIMRAGSGHIGSSFSSLDIVSWLFLNEIAQSDGSETGDGSCNIYYSSKGHDVPGL